MGGGKPVYRRVEARPIEDQNARRDEGSEQGRQQVRVRFWRGRRNDRGGWSDQPGQSGTLLSVKAEAPDTWIVGRKKGSRLLLKATWKLSSDDSTLTDYYREFESDGSTLSMDYVYQRTGGGSGFAADWQGIKETMNSPFLMEVKEFQGDGLS